jgi:hypothetical protein
LRRHLANGVDALAKQDGAAVCEEAAQARKRDSDEREREAFPPAHVHRHRQRYERQRHNYQHHAQDMFHITTSITH